MHIVEEKRGEVKVVVVRGRLDALTSPVLEKRIQELLDLGENRLALDFSELSYISSLGLRVLIMAAKNLQKVNGKLGLAALNEDIFDVFKMAGFTKVFSIHPTIEETVQFCAQ